MRFMSNIPIFPKRLCRNRGLPSASFEINDDPKYQDYISSLGFAYAVSMTLRLWKLVACLRSR